MVFVDGAHGIKYLSGSLHWSGPLQTETFNYPAHEEVPLWPGGHPGHSITPAAGPLL